MNLDAAYYHIHANTRISSTCIAIVDNFYVLFLCLLFGTKPAPVEYTTVSEAEIDLGNDLLRGKS